MLARLTIHLAGEGPCDPDTALEGWYIHCCWAVVAVVCPDFSWGAGVDQIVLFSTLDQAPETEAVGLVGGNGLQFVAEIFSEIVNVGCCWAVTQSGDIAKPLKSIVVGDER